MARNAFEQDARANSACDRNALSAESSEGDVTKYTRIWSEVVPVAFFRLTSPRRELDDGLFVGGRKAYDAHRHPRNRRAVENTFDEGGHIGGDDRCR